MPPRKLSPNEIYGVRWIPFTLQTTFLPRALSLSLFAPLVYDTHLHLSCVQLGLSSSLDATILFTARQRNNRGVREQEGEGGGGNLSIRGVKRSVSGPNEYPAERSTPRYPAASARARAHTVPWFLRQPRDCSLLLSVSRLLSRP